MSSGIIMAGADTPMVNVTFDNVVFTNPLTKQFENYYNVENV